MKQYRVVGNMDIQDLIVSLKKKLQKAVEKTKKLPSLQIRFTSSSSATKFLARLVNLAIKIVLLLFSLVILSVSYISIFLLTLMSLFLDILSTIRDTETRPEEYSKDRQTPIKNGANYGMKFSKNGEFTGEVVTRPKDEISEELKKISILSSGNITQTNKERVWSVIKKSEQAMKTKKTVDNCYWLGIAYRNYCARFIKGDDRKKYRDKAIKYLELAFDLSKDVLPIVSTDNFEWLSQVVIADEIIRLLMTKNAPEDSDKSMKYTRFIFDSIEGYSPSMMDIMRHYRSNGQYDEAIKLAKEIRRRANTDKEWRGLIKVDYDIVSSLRGLRDEAKRNKDYKNALKWSNKISRFKKYYSEADEKKHKKLIELNS